MLDESSLKTDIPLADLGPLAWVFEELRKSLDLANKGIKRFIRESDQSGREDQDAVDPVALRTARQQIHQAVGALEVVGLVAPAQVLRAMEAAVKRFGQKPQTCTEESAAKIERASFALVEYLEGVLNNKAIQPIALFAQYREVQELAGAERVHPADLWPFDHQHVVVGAPVGSSPLKTDATVRSLLDRLILLVVKTQSPAAAQQVARICAGLSAGASDNRVVSFWRVAAAFFEAGSQGLLPVDVFTKRAASRVLLQFANFAQGGGSVSETLLHDLLFFCCNVRPKSVELNPHLTAVRKAFGFNQAEPVDYTQATLGRYDPTLLSQARKRINAAKESWSLFTGGDISRSRQVQDQYGLIGDSMMKLHADSSGLAQSLVKAVDRGAKEGAGVRAELAMEVATTTLYLEAAFEDFDPNDAQLSARTRALAERLDRVVAGEPAQPLDAWMEQLYRRVSDRQTMGSVVGELKVSLAEAEKSLDQFFRNRHEKGGLHVAVAQLSQMRGVLSVLGLDQAVHTVVRMRQSIEQILDAEAQESPERTASTFETLGHNLSALSFLVDMLNYQPALARKLFVFDDGKGELMPMMGRTVEVPSGDVAASKDAAAVSAGVQRVVDFADSGHDLAGLSQQLGDLADQASLAEQPGVARAAREAAQALVSQSPEAGAQALVDLSQTAPAPLEVEPVTVTVSHNDGSGDDDDDLLGIFLEEAAEVVANGQASVGALAAESNALEHLTTLRRAFHTLKGSSRMVGLTEFGEAGWAMEQVFNGVLAEQKGATPGLLQLASDALQAFDQWTQDIAAKKDGAWKAKAFQDSAMAWRERTEVLPIATPSTVAQAAVEPKAALPKASRLVADFADTQPFELPPAASQALTKSGEGADGTALMGDIDFALLSTLTSSRGDLTEDAGATSDDSRASSKPANSPSDVLSSMFADIDLDLDLPPDSALMDLPLDLDTEPLPTLSADSAAAVDIDLFEGGELVADSTLDIEWPDATPETAPAEWPPVASMPDEPPTLTVDDGFAEPVFEAEPASDEATREIGPLRIGLKLYNVYLNEADEWSRRLCTCLAEWSLERHEPVHEHAEALAHSLAGSSATVGFQPLSEIARALEHALASVSSHQVAGYAATAEQAQLFVDAAEDIRRLLHQFAAGFYKDANPALLAALNELVHAAMPEEGSSAFAAVTEFGDTNRTEFAPSVYEEVNEPQIDAPPHAEPLDGAQPVNPVTEPAPQSDPDSGYVPLTATTFNVGDLPTLTVSVQDAAAPHAQAQDIDDDIDVSDTIDVDLFPIFTEEALELLPQLGGALRQWVAKPGNAAARSEVLRHLHTIKGSARLAGALRLGEMAHRLETDAERLGSDVNKSADIEPLLGSFDAINARFELLRGVDSQAPNAGPLVAQPVVDDVVGLSISLPETALSEENAPAEPIAGVELASTAVKGLSGMELPQAPIPVQARAGAAVRVRPELLDRLVNQAGEVMITRSRMESEQITLRSSLKDLTGNLDRLRQQLRDIELQAETQMQSRLAQARDSDQSFDPLEFDRFTRVQELTRMMAESVNDVATVQRNLQRAVEATEDSLVAQARQTRELQRDLLRTRMVEFEGISERLYRVVRQASKETGKQVRLDISGGNIEMDRGVLDRMTAAFEHLLRNSVVHGIELPDDRVAAGKAAEGHIDIVLAQELNDVSVVFQDDGQGLNLSRLREKALSMGIASDPSELSDAQAAQLVFTPGLSTATELTSLAGRGVGMDVVRTDVVALGGRIETSSQEGKGTSFKLVLPLTTAVTQVVMVRAGGFTFGVPSNLVEVVRRLTHAELEQAYGKHSLTVAGEEVPFYWAGALLQSTPRSLEAKGRTLPAVIFRSAAQRLSMHVDEVLGNQEVVVKNLGPQLQRLPGLAGMSVLASGAVALIYNPVALATVYGGQVREWIAAQDSQAKLRAPDSVDVSSSMDANVVPLVLVVDDSITVRRVTQRLLQREGYRVSMAADGLQALERLQVERPTLVLSDIEMPRMDGFDLVRNIRNDPRLADLPVVMITSRIAEKHREHARELGVDHYLGKPYSEDELLALIAHYAKLAAAA